METTTNSATGTLRQDHIAVLAELGRLSDAGRQLTSQSEAEAGEARRVIGEVADFLAKELEIHLQKEEEALFPPMEEVIGSGGGPIAVMRYEHVDMRADSQALGELAADLVDAEKASQNVRKLQGTITHLCDLLTQHIHKEDFILFNMADDMLSGQAADEVLAKMAEIETR
ncbi:MAG: hemerythrin domain-containing protein [Chloroflexi bacterium]|nr:hemerythrin domain-containing protein [Chloroflexota bacterium]